MAKIVDPSVVQFGDEVALNGRTWTVKDVSGPDRFGAYDFYLANENSAKYEVITDAVLLVL